MQVGHVILRRVAHIEKKEFSLYSFQVLFHLHVSQDKEVKKNHATPNEGNTLEE